MHNSLERILNFPVNCCGIEYVASAMGPMKIYQNFMTIS